MDFKQFQKKNKKPKSNNPNPAPRLPNVGNSEKECRDSLLDKLLKLKEYGIIKHSISPNANEFEVLEFYGDSVLYERISSFIMHTRRFMNPHLMTTLRSFIVQNRNLALCYDTLGIQSLLSNPPADMPFKEKADVIEAVIGELAEAADDEGTQHAQASKILSELLTYICYLGEKTYFTNLSLAEEQKSQQQQLKEATSSALLTTPHATSTNMSIYGSSPNKDRSVSPRKNSYPPHAPVKKTTAAPLTAPVVTLPLLGNSATATDSVLDSTKSKKKTPLLINGQPTVLLTRGTPLPGTPSLHHHVTAVPANQQLPTQRSDSQSRPMFYTPVSRSAPSSFGPADSAVPSSHSPVMEYHHTGAAPTETSSWVTDSRADHNTDTAGVTAQHDSNSTPNRLLLANHKKYTIPGANQTQVGGRQIYEYREIKV